MEKLFEIASKTTTPLGIAGIIALAVFLILQQLIQHNSFPALTQRLNPDHITLLIKLSAGVLALAIVSGLIGYLLPILWGDGKQPSHYTGRVTDTKTNRPIPHALVSIEVDQEVPQIQSTDQQGIFSVNLPSSVQAMRIRVEAEGYDVFERRGSPNRTGVEDISLVPKPMPIPNVVSDSASITLREGRTLRSALEDIAELDDSRADIQKCSGQFMKSIIRGGYIHDATVEKLLDQLQFRIRKPKTGERYKVTRSEREKSYVIQCGST